MIHANKEDGEEQEVSPEEEGLVDSEEGQEVPEEEMSEEQEIPEEEQAVAPEQEMSEEAPAEELAPQEMPEQNMDAEPAEDQDAIKQRVTETLLNFKQNKDKIQALEQTDPETYHSVIEMIQRMIEMAKQFKPKEGEEAINEEEIMGGLNPQAPHLGMPVKKP